MTYSFQVHFSVCRGLGPQWDEKSIPVAFDDIDPEVPEQTVKEWAINEARAYLNSRMEPGYPKPVFLEIYNA